MLYLLIAVEGESERGLISALVKKLAAQAPIRYGKIEVVPISVGGNHGYKRLVEIAENSINAYIANPDHCFESGDDIEKWLVCDYDDMDNKGITRSELLEKANKKGFELIISKPNFEFFILATLSSFEHATKVDPSHYIFEINQQIKQINEKNIKEKPWITDSMRIPKYGKRTQQCENCLGVIFSFYPDLLERMREERDSDEGDKYSEMPRLIKRIYELIQDKTE